MEVVLVILVIIGVGNLIGGARRRQPIQFSVGLLFVLVAVATFMEWDLAVGVLIPIFMWYWVYCAMERARQRRARTAAQRDLDRVFR